MTPHAAPRVVSQDRLPALIDELLATARDSADRHVLGIAGPPGSGKSALAERIVASAEFRCGACVAPMDGFHRSNEELVALGLLPLKGVPESFDAEGFVERLALLNGPNPVTWPTYDRARGEVVPAGSRIAADTNLVVVEGNYLLLAEPPWNRVRRHLDVAWYLDVPEAALLPRLQARHERRLGSEGARVKVASTDLPNAALVATTRDRADVIIRTG